MDGIEPVQTAIELFDAFTAPMMSIINAANLGANAIAAMQDAVSANIDPLSVQMMTQSIEEAQTAAERFQEALRGMEISETSVPEFPSPREPVQIPFEWQSANSIEIFNTSGAERWQQEIASAQDMMEQLAQAQERIAYNAMQVNFLPPDAANDIAALNDRIGDIQQRIQQISANRLNATSPEAIAQTEQLREQLNSCLQVQNRMNSAIEAMDLEAANRAYLELEQTIRSTGRYIRNNISAQGDFNNAVRAGQTEADKLTGFLQKAAGAFLSIKTVDKIVEMSDNLVTAKSRLAMMNDGLQSTDELYSMIYGAAQRARGALDGMADVAARFGNNAKDAFSGNEEVIAFSELIQKQMTIAGASTSEASNAMLQLSQALGSGVLRGDELNSIFEQAPNLIQGIADYLDVPIGQIRAMASEGQITADIVKASVFASADEINQKFASMPMTWGQMWQSMQNQATVALEPLLEKVNKIFNDDRFQTGLSGIMGGFVILASVALEALSIIGGTIGWVVDNWSALAPIVFTAVGAFAAYKIAVAAASAVQAVHNAILAANPVVLIIISILVLIAAIYSVCESIAKFTGIANSGFGMICGGVMIVIATFKNLGFWVANIALGIWEALQACGENIYVVFYNCIKGVQAFWYGLLSTVLSVVAGICEALNKIPFISFDYSGISSKAEEYAQKATNANNSKLDYTDVGAAFDRGFNTFDAFKDGWVEEAYNSGASWGDGVVDNINSMLGGLSATVNIKDYAAAYSGIGSSISDIADNTAAIKDGLDLTDEDLKYLRDIAERETINRFTTAEIKIEWNNTQNISSEMDLDGVVEYLTEGVQEAMESTAEGVHV